MGKKGPEWPGCFCIFQKTLPLVFLRNNLKLKLILLLIFHRQSQIWQDSSSGCCQPIKLQDSLKCNISGKKWKIKCDFCMQINIKVLYKLILPFCVGATRHAQSIQNKKSAYLCNISSKAWGMKLLFCLQINTKVFYKLIVSLWACLARHAQSTQNNKFTISQGKFEGRTWSFVYRLTSKVCSNCYYYFRCVCSRHAQITQNNKFAIFL